MILLLGFPYLKLPFSTQQPEIPVSQILNADDPSFGSAVFDNASNNSYRAVGSSMHQEKPKVRWN